jgi:hypothetical protein
VVDYEFRFVGHDGRVAFLCVSRCADNSEARAFAKRMMLPEFASGEIWLGMDCIATLLPPRVLH